MKVPLRLVRMSHTNFSAAACVYSGCILQVVAHFKGNVQIAYCQIMSVKGLPHTIPHNALRLCRSVPRALQHNLLAHLRHMSGSAIDGATRPQFSLPWLRQILISVSHTARSR